MATLIQSKQIEGIVTASVIEGNFSVQSGSVDLTSASGVTGSFSGSFVGDGSGLTNIPYSNITGTPIFKAGSNVTITSSSNVITIASTGGGGGSNQSLNSFTASYYIDSASFDSRIVGISASGSGADWNTNLQNIPSGLVSGSVLRTLDGTGVLSGSIIDQLPSGLISSSAQITDGSGIVSGSVLRNLDGTGVVSGSVLRNLDGTNIFSGSFIGGTNVTISSGSGTITISSSGGVGSVPEGTISGSAQITALGFVSQSFSTDGSGIVSGSVLRNLDGTGVFSGSLVAGTNITINQVGNNFEISSSASGGSSDFTQLTNVPSGLVSGSTQITDGSGIVSGSVLRTLDGTDVVSGSVVRTLAGTGVVSGSVLRTLDGTGVISGSVLRTLDGTNVISSSAQITALGFISESTFDGDRIVSNTDLPSGVYNNNFGTSGSVQDFLNAVFFPNSAPSISTGNKTIQEFSGSGATILTLSGTDTEGQSLTWGTASAYTDDLVRVASNGVMTLNATATSASFNTDLVSGTTYGHQVTVTATDTFNATTEKDIYVIVTPNEAPKFRETSVAGNVITSVTQAVNENSSDNTLIKRVYFTDNESDSITITSSSILPSEHFTITKSSTYVDIRQNTGSLDYENITQYTFSITASDEHYPAQDSNAVITLPITINVTDNIVPSISNQTISGLNENSSNGASAGSISATDSEGDAITFVSFDLHKLLLDGSTVTSGSYGGTSQASDPHENPFQMDSSGNVTRKTGVYLNSDLINSYQYRVTVRDNYNSTNSTAGIISIPISDDTAPTISTNGTFRIVESATSGDLVRTTSNGYSGTQARLTSNQSVTWSDDSGMISINSSGYISLSSNVDGVYTSGQSFTANVTATNSFGTTTTQSITINVVANGAPTISFTNHTANFETDLALSGVTMVSMSVTDQESDTPYSASLTGTDASSFRLVYTNANSSSIGLQATSNLSVGTYSYNIKVTDNYDKSTTYSGRTITIATSADYGKTYLYRSNYGVGSLSGASYLALMGASSVDGSTPPEVTGYTVNTESPFRLISSSLGDNTLTLAGGGTATLVSTLSGSNLSDIIEASSTYTVGGVSEQYIIIIPSGSDMTGIPTSMTDGFGDSTVGRYVMAINADGGGWGAEASTIHLLDTSGSFNGYDKHFIIGRTGPNAASSIDLRLIPASGSLPS